MLKRLLQDGKKNIISDFYIVFNFYEEIFYKKHVLTALEYRRRTNFSRNRLHHYASSSEGISAKTVLPIGTKRL